MAETVAEALARGADNERRLLKNERKAERAVEDLRLRTESEREQARKAQARLDRTLAKLAAAEAERAAAREARASGPAPSAR